jgi:xanthine dehydrogenase FAD-binding subunit
MAGSRGGMEKLKRIKGHDLALASVALVKNNHLVRVAIGACAPTPVVLKDFSLPVSVEEIQQEAEKSINPIDDVRASRDYRIFMVRTFIERLMERVK